MLAAGKYYVGDLCYVLTEKNGYDWDDVLDKTDTLNNGEHVYNGVRLFLPELLPSFCCGLNSLIASMIRLSVVPALTRSLSVLSVTDRPCGTTFVS